MTPLDQGTCDRIGFVLRSWLTSTRPMPAGFRALAREAQVLPVASGWMESHGLRIDGEVVRWASHPDVGASDVLIEPDARRRRWVLFQASRRFPELADLAPKRTRSAADCTRCGATGRDPELRDAPADAPTECLRCGGMGWFLPEELGEPSRWHSED